MKKNKKPNKFQKLSFKSSKAQLHQQLVDDKISKKFKKIIKNRGNINSQLLNLSIIKDGVKNKVKVIEKEFFQCQHKYQKNPSYENKILCKKLKIALKKEKQIEKQEIKQIKKLNNKPKGQVNVIIDKNLVIKINNVGKYYPTKGFIKKALSEVNLTFQKGSFNVILGESGSGKTTLLNVISGLDRATLGEVVINDINIQSLNDKELTLFRRENTGFVFQSYNLLASLNVRDNIEIGRSLQNDGNKRHNISTLLENMNMYDQEKKMIYELSGGQQQRVSIARALSKTPKILICDEPTGSLDQMTSKKVFNIFKKINKQQGTTIIIVTHDPRVIEIAHQVIKIEDGKITNVYQNASPNKGFVL